MVTVIKPVFISMDHQQALIISEKDAASEESGLTRGDKTASMDHTGSVRSISTKTGSTKQPKVQAAFKYVSIQYTAAIVQLQAQIAALTSL